MSKKFITYFIILFALASSGFSQDGQGGTESNLAFGFGARALALGHSYTALADDPTAVFWNPAGLENVQRQSLTLFHTSLWEGTLYDFIGYVYPSLNIGSFGVGLARIGVGGILETNIYNELISDNVSHEQYEAFLSYAKKIPWDLTVGVSVRILRYSWNGLSVSSGYGDLNTMSVGGDIGMLYAPIISNNVWLRGWTLGLSARNVFAPVINEGVSNDRLPLSMKFGVLRKVYFAGKKSVLNLLFDLKYSQKKDMGFSFGAEYSFNNFAMLRIGYEDMGLSFGAGLQYGNFQLDYAFGNSPNSDLFSSVHRISLTANFGMTRDEKFEEEARRIMAEREKMAEEIRKTDRENFINEHMKNADNYFTEKKYSDAIVEYQQVVGMDPFNQRATMMLDSSNIMLQKEFEAQQVIAIQNAIDAERAEANAQFVKEHYDKGRLFLKNKQFTEALIEFNLALERDPNNETVKSSIATTNRRLQEEITSLLKRSRQEFNRQNYSEALRLIAEVRMLGAGSDQAFQKEVDLLAQIYKLNEQIQEGLTLLELGEYEKASIVFQSVLQLDPTNQTAKSGLERAKIETVGQAKMSPEIERKWLRGVNEFVKGKYLDAIKIWQEILVDYPYNKKVLDAIKDAKSRIEDEGKK
jgi:tetratricopeptide (TPR) repeat protein